MVLLYCGLRALRGASLLRARRQKTPGEQRNTCIYIYIYVYIHMYVYIYTYNVYIYIYICTIYVI